MSFVGVSSRFGVTLFPTIGKQTLIFINVTSFHLTLIDDLKGKKSSFILHSFCTHTLSFFYTEKSFIVNEMASPSSKSPTLLKVTQTPQAPTMHLGPFLIPFPLLFFLSIFKFVPSLLKFQGQLLGMGQILLKGAC